MRYANLLFSGFCLLVWPLVTACQSQTTDTPKGNSTVIAFGSCYDKSRGSSAIFQAVANNQPDLWVWLGDIVYGDTHDMRKLRNLYTALKNTPDYQLVASSTTVIGTWDDHDYGQNDGGKYYSKKDESKQVLLDFLDVSADSDVRGHSGVYSTHMFTRAEQKIKIILLDARTFRDTLQAGIDGHNRYRPNPTGDVLGEEQWQWLESELQKDDADMHIIGSGYQIIPWEQGYEKWSNFPKARKRLFDLLKKYKPKRTFLISGDRHIAEISKVDLADLPYPLYEFTSSGLTHTWSTDWPEENVHRIGNKIVKKNFGIIRINWHEGGVQVIFEVRGLSNELLFSHSANFN